MSEPLLRIEDLRVTYRGGGFLAFRRSQVRAVDGVSFEVQPGETFGLVGESGSGKSTTGRAILRLTPIASGSIVFDGTDVGSMGRSTPLSYRRQVQAVFQDPWSSLNPRKVIGEILAAPLLRHRLVRSRPELQRRISELLDQVGMADYFAGRYPSELSGGQRQRVSIARALAVEPSFVVCDEPVSALDVSTQSQAINLFKDLQERLGLAYLFIAHDLSVVSHISHRIGVMYRGRLVETGVAAEVHRRPAHPYTQALVASEPVPDPVLQAARRQARRLGREQIKAVVETPVYEGCPFEPRCPKAMSCCRTVVPPLLPRGEGGSVACHLYVEGSG
jgi:oligopeptide/dipeptide ABC transporter ATP-binding protein